MAIKALTQDQLNGLQQKVQPFTRDGECLAETAVRRIEELTQDKLEWARKYVEAVALLRSVLLWEHVISARDIVRLPTSLKAEIRKFLEQHDG